jgi:hypothetical protein
VFAGSLRTEMIGSGKLKFPQLFVGQRPVALPEYWAKTVRRQGTAMRFRVASSEGPGVFFDPHQVVETESSLSIEWEDANVPGRRRISRVWYIPVLVVSAFAAVGLLLSAFALHVSPVAAIDAIRLSRLPVFSYDIGDELKEAGPIIGVVWVRNAWELRTANLSDSPAEANFVIVTKTARDRMWNEHTSRGAGRSEQPTVQRLSAADVVAYAKLSMRGLPANGRLPFDPYLSDLRESFSLGGEISTDRRPYLIAGFDGSGVSMDEAYVLFGGLVALLVFLPCAWMLGRDLLQIRAFARQARLAYARIGVDLEA